MSRRRPPGTVDGVADLPLATAARRRSGQLAGVAAGRGVPPHRGVAAVVPVGTSSPSASTIATKPCVLSDGRIASLWRERPGSHNRRELKIMTPDGAAYAMLVIGVDIEQIGCGG